jgi:ATP-dependent Clp protease ATP-binding subunit ClpA
MSRTGSPSACGRWSWETLRQTLRPEFLNRIDEIVIFKPLGREEIEKIVTIQRLIQDPLALQILNGTFKEGDTIVVDAKRGQVGFRKAVDATPV